MPDIQMLGLFRDVTKAADAIDQLRKLGVTDNQITVISGIPYNAQILGRPKPKSCVGRMALIGALTGAAVAAFLTAGIWLLYDLTQGGQAQIPIPPSLIVLFELTMLGTMWTSFFSMLVANRFPAMKRRIYDIRITEDSIGVISEVDGNLGGKIEQALKDNGAYEVQQDSASPKVDVGYRGFWATVIGGLVVVTIIGGLFVYDIFRIPFGTQMYDQESISYEQGPRLAAPAEAVPIQGPVLIAGQPASEPIPATTDSVQRGQVLFGVTCVPCHGATGQGNGPVSKFFPATKPADLTSAPIQSLTDDDIFLVLTQGFGVMPSMAENLDTQDRWDVINYVRTLKK
jgi:mono/diheme cytochrome c family protein